MSCICKCIATLYITTYLRKHCQFYSTPSYSTLCWLRLKYHFVVTKLGHSHSVSKVTMTQEDELRLGADGYLQKLLTRKTVLDHIWNGFKFTCIFFSLVCLSNGYMCILKTLLIQNTITFLPKLVFEHLQYLLDTKHGFPQGHQRNTKSQSKDGHRWEKWRHPIGINQGNKEKLRFVFNIGTR